MMKKLILLLVLAVGLVHAQLNFEGNPLTDNTEYAAEESRFSPRAAIPEDTTPRGPGNRVTGRPQRLYLVSHENAASDTKNAEPAKSQVVIATEKPTESVTRQNLSEPSVRPASSAPSARHLTPNAYNQGTSPVSHASLALDTFLNSKTPEESRLALERYLQSREPMVQNESGQQQLPVSLPNGQQQLAHQRTLQEASQIDRQRSFAASSTVNQRLTSQLAQRQMLQTYPVVDQGQRFLQATGQVYDQTLANVPAGVGLAQQQLLQQVPYVSGLPAGIQARGDFFYPLGWQQRLRRIRGRPYPFAQSRLGPGLYKGPVPGPFKHKGPVEVIYTRPPGFHRGPPAIGNPSVKYEDTSAWFPDADYPPPNKGVLYSQLYAQSYDPHYYNYIAKTGKIKPHLYGKLGKPLGQKDDGIWSELYQGFKKHGLKNMLTPGFLLGMTLPVVTLMLTALVQKRSLGRSESRQLSAREDALQEYLERLQGAMECYERKRRTGNETDNPDEC